MAIMNKIIISILLMLAAACATPRRTADLTFARFMPNPIYQIWASDAIACAISLKENAQDPVNYEIEKTEVDITQIVWLLVISEADNGQFQCNQKEGCIGLFIAPDTVYISSRWMRTPWVVKHEVMHYAVKNDKETLATHGAPWGICEFM